jgi:hypothetical protein
MKGDDAMNGKLILSLSLFGLMMGVATVFVIPPNIEPFAWLAIFIFCALVIARREPSRPFVHGLLTSLVNSVWITAAHLALFDRYIAGHAREASMVASAPFAPRIMMLMVGPVIGLVSGLVLGLFALAARKVVPAKAA